MAAVAIVATAVVCGYVSWQYPGLPEVIQINFPDLGGIVRIGNKSELLHIAYVGAAILGLNLVVGYAGQIAIGWVSMLTLGAYTTAALAAGRVGPEWHPYLALLAGGVMGAIFGVIVGLPALRLRTFYFAMTTLGFATIVTQVALAWKEVTGGGVGTPGPTFP